MRFDLEICWLNVSPDCTLLDNMKTEFITAHEGSSVLLSCSCTDIHSKPATFMWKKKNPGKSTWEVILSESESNRKQIRLLNTRSPGNLSLLVSHLTEEDEGVYICFVERNQYRYMRLTVKGNYNLETFELKYSAFMWLSAFVFFISCMFAAVTGKNMVYFPIATFAAIIFHIVIIVYVIKEDKSKITSSDLLCNFISCMNICFFISFAVSCLPASVSDPTRVHYVWWSSESSVKKINKREQNSYKYRFTA